MSLLLFRFNGSTAHQKLRRTQNYLLHIRAIGSVFVVRAICGALFGDAAPQPANSTLPLNTSFSFHFVSFHFILWQNPSTFICMRIDVTLCCMGSGMASINRFHSIPYFILRPESLIFQCVRLWCDAFASVGMPRRYMYRIRHPSEIWYSNTHHTHAHSMRSRRNRTT